MTDEDGTGPSEKPGPGWYPADGDPPGTVRYWDGETWIGGPRSPGSQTQSGSGNFIPIPARPPDGSVPTGSTGPKFWDRWRKKKPD